MRRFADRDHQGEGTVRAQGRACGGSSSPGRWAVRVGIAAVVLSSLAGAPAVLPAEEAAPAGQTAPSAEVPFEFDTGHLRGGDEELGKLAAIRLLQAITRNPQASRDRHLQFLKTELDPAAIEAAAGNGPERLAAARRIVEAITGEIKRSGPPVPDTSAILLELVGRGPEDLRDAVVRALEEFIDRADADAAKGLHQRQSAREVVEELGRRIQHNPPPSPALLEDASRILWRSRGKELMGFLMAGLAHHGPAAPAVAAAYLRELRGRLRVDFGGIDGWQAWWDENKERTLEEILVALQRHLSEQGAERWRQSLRRLRETNEANLVLGELQDVVKGASTLELRLAAVSALGEFADWVRDSKLAAADAGSLEKLRGELLERGCDLLLGVAEGTVRPFELREVTRAAIISLRRYQAFLERRPDLGEKISRVVATRLEAAVSRPGDPLTRQSRSDLLETVRTAGVLRVVGAAAPLEEILRSSRHSADLELLTEATLALGRLVDRSLTGETADLIIAHFHRAGSAALPGIGDFRRACVSALKARPESPAVADKVRAFYLEVLGAAGAKDLRIPAILGLGTLAQDADPAAREALAAIVRQVGDYQPPEVIAALDEIAYVGGTDALGHLLPFLSMAEKLAAANKGLVDHLWRRITGLVKAGGVQVLAWAMERLASSALAEDTAGLLETALKLYRDPELADLISPEKVGLTEAAAVQALWRATWLAAGAAELAAPGDTKLAERLARLAGDATARNHLPEAEAQLAALRKRQAALAALEARLAAAETVPPQEFLKASSDVVALSRGDPGELWRTLRRLEAALGRLADSETTRTLLEVWLGYLRSPEHTADFSALPGPFLPQYTGRLERLRNRGAEKQPAAATEAAPR